jgi:hypothetical protein
MNLENRVIKAETYNHAKQIIAWFKSNGVDTSFFVDTDLLPNEKDGGYCQYYGIIHGQFECWTKGQVNAYDSEIMYLPEESVYEPLLNVIL